MRSEGFPFIVWGSGGWTLVRLQLLVASPSFRVYGEATKPLLFEGHQAGSHVVCVAGVVLCDIPTCLITCRKCQNWRTSRTKRSFCCAHVSRLESLVFLWRRRIYGGSCKTSVSSRVSACPLASPCLWGKLQSRQSLACFAALTSPCLWWKLQNLSLCLSSGVAVSLGEAAKPISSRVSACPLASPCLWGKLQSLACFAALTSPCLWGKLQNLSLVSSFCLSSGVAVFVVEAAKPRLFCCAHVVSSLCLSSGVAVSMGKAAKLRLFCCAHVAVSMGEAAKLQSRLGFLLVLWRRRIYGGSCKTSVSSRVSACPLASPCLWGKLQSRQSLACFAALTSPCLWGKLQNLVFVQVL